MPYEVIMDAENCDGHAVVKVGTKQAVDGGCHQTHQEALDQMTALNIATADERSQRNEQMSAAIDEAISLLMAAKSGYEQEQKEEEPMSMSEMDDDDDDDNEMEYSAEINLVPPVYMRAAARRGLRLYEEGKGGDGLVRGTIIDARKMMNGEALSADKWKRIGPWIARHMVDLDAPKNRNPDDPEYPGAGLVAHLLWGSGPSKANAQRAMDYANRLSDRIDEERAPSEPAPKSDQIKGSKVNPKGSAQGKTGSITLDDNTTKALQTKASEHNKKMEEGGRPNWTRVRLGALKAVWRRGAGAYSTSHRPGVSRAAWAMARVNAFLVLARTGRPANPKYVGDNDLLHSDHPKYSKGS